ncbi:hypothetical protein TRFO_29219 [Tritrichomonas foetus]|uniref:Uncharacterized protein n=1 Tax=Tritrichomonas foetus TaxID=1144522 RepID=A0A1J4JW45_9EUKA|nr:hypothetical protein TRFO_29219 [Tritrichomonas foetus]|eukprot:OHT03361.1 hypothetical protein TRFO_29219 [Tritrichomonas foetus]
MDFFSSTTFAPNPDQCNFFSFSINNPSNINDIPLIKQRFKCENCNSYILKENVCPICSPETYFNDQDKIQLNTFNIPVSYDVTPGPAFLFILDLDLPLNELIELSRLLVLESKNGDCSKFNGNVFYFAFLGNQISFFSWNGNKIRFSFIPTIFDFRSFAKPLIIYSEWLEKAIIIAKEYLVSAEDKTSSLQELFKFLKDVDAITDIQDILFIFHRNLPKNIKYHFSPRFHLIQIATHSSKSYIDFACRFKATFYASPHMNKETIKHIKECMVEDIVLVPRFYIKTSKGIGFHDFSGPISKISHENNNTVAVELFSCSPLNPVIALATATNKKLYLSQKFYSFQLVILSYSGLLMITNYVFKRANSISEWISSFNKEFLLYTMLQDQGTKLFSSYINSGEPWLILFRRPKLLKDCEEIKICFDLLSKFFEILFQPTKAFLSETKKVYFLFEFCFGKLENSLLFIKYLIDECMETSNYILLPPFILVNVSDGSALNDTNDTLGNLIYFKISEQKFIVLKTLVDSFKKELHNTLTTRVTK